METEIQLKGKPYYISETEEGVYYAIDSLNNIETLDDGSTSWCYEFVEEIGKLEENLDIRLLNTKGLTLVIRRPEYEIPWSYKELRDFAILCHADYYTIEKTGDQWQRFLTRENNWSVYEVKPKLFIKLGND